MPPKRYYVSNHGKVVLILKTKKETKVLVMKQIENKDGYNRISLRNGMSALQFVHRAVLWTFHGPA